MKTRPHLIPALIVAIMLLVAIAPLPYGYFQFLRWAVCGVAVFIAVKSYTWQQTWAIWLFGAVAVMFNPILPIDLTREIWQPIDLAGALLFGLSILLLPELAAKSIGWITTIVLSLFLMLAGIGFLFASAEIAGSIVFVIGFAVLVLPFAFGWEMGSNYWRKIKEGSNRLGAFVWKMGSNRLWLIIAIVWLIIAGVNVMTSNPISALKYQWEKEKAFDAYYAIPTDPDEAQAQKKPTRTAYRKAHPTTEAKLFITGRIDTISTDMAIEAVIRLVRENKIDPASISGVTAHNKQRAKRGELGLPVKTTLTRTDKLVARLNKLKFSKAKTAPVPTTPRKMKYNPFLPENRK